jgi:23S rRNA (uracil1939-C5)-methyltransferase
VNVRADRFDDDGLGVGVADGTEVHVTDLLPGETAAVDVQHRSHHRARAWAIVRERIGDPSPDRTAPVCPGFGRCGGCAVQHASYAMQLAAKRARVVQALAGAAVDAIVPSPRVTGYRNKGKYVVGHDGERALLGAYEPRSHVVVRTVGCQVVEPAIDAMAGRAEAALAASSLAVYDERTRAGDLRHVILRANAGGDVLVALVSRSSTPRDAIARVAAQLPEASGVVWVRNDTSSGAIVSGDIEPIAGRPAIVEEIAGVRLAIGVAEFFQVNRDQATRLYTDLARRIGAGPDTRAIDVYCGVGGIAFTLAARGSQVVGVERHAGSVAAANAAASAAGLTGRASFCAAPAAELAAIAAELGPQVAVVNPPRKGLDAATRAALGDIAPATIAYVSCDPDSLARDLSLLADYTLESATPYDLMPGTLQVETLAVLRRR